MDFKPLLEELKQDGLEITEDVVRAIVKKLFAHIKKYAAQSENKFDDLIIPLLPSIEAYVTEQVDKIDGICDDCPK